MSLHALVVVVQEHWVHAAVKVRVHWLCYLEYASMFEFNPCAVFPGQLINVECWKEFAVEKEEQNVDCSWGRSFASGLLPVIFMLKHHDYQGAFFICWKAS